MIKNNQTETKKKLIFLEIILLLLIVAIGGWLRFSSLEGKSFWYDEGVTRLIISGKAEKLTFFNKPVDISVYRNFIIPEKGKYASGIINGLVKSDTHPPFYFLLLRNWTNLFGLSDLSLRSMSAFFGTVSIIPFFFLAVMLFDIKTALIASFFFATGYFHIAHCQEARMYPLSLFLAIVSTLIIFYIRKIQDSRNYGFYASLLTFIAVSIAGLYTHYQYIFILLFHFSYLWSKCIKDHKFRLFTTISAISILIFYLPWFPDLIIQKERTKYLSSIIGANFSIIDAVKKFPRTIEVLMMPKDQILYSGKLLFILSVAAGFAYILFFDKQNKRPIFLWTFFLTVPTLLMGYFSGISLSYTSPKYFFMLLPVLYLLPAVALSRIKIPLMSSILIAFLCTYSLIEGYRESGEKNILPSDGIRETARIIDLNFTEGDMVIFNSSNGRGDILIFSSYIKNPLNVFVLYPGTSKKELLKVLKNGRRFWYLFTPQSDGKIKFSGMTPLKFLEKNLREKMINSIPSLNISLFTKKK